MKKPVHRVTPETAAVEPAPPLTKVPITMEIFENRYYRLSKNCMTLIGQWPDQTARVRRGILAFMIFVTVTMIAPVIFALVKHRDDWGITFDCINACLYVILNFIKLLGIVCNSQKTLKLLNRIIANWQVWAQDQECNIIHEYAEQGEKMTFAYTDVSILLEAVVLSTVILFTTQPMIPKIIDVVLRNGTEFGKFPYPVDFYFFDAHKYYYYIMMYFYICVCIVTMPVVASDTMLIIYVQHECGVFAALGLKLEQIENNCTSVDNAVQLSSVVDRHNDAVEFANLIEAVYTWNLFFVIGFGIIMVDLLALQILLKTNEPDETMRYIAFIVAVLLQFFMECYIFQTLMDHSINVGFHIYNSQWYRLLAKDQKLLQLMTMRCRIPCQITAGKMLVMSIRNFGLICRTAMSYFTVIHSVERF